MDASDNSRTLPVVTRRRLLSTSAAWLAAQVADVNGALHPESRGPDGGDPTLILWREWTAAHEQVEQLCQRQQRLETALIAAVGFPHVDIAAPDQDCVVAVFSVEEIDCRFGDAPESSEAKIRAKAVLAKRQAEWDALDQRTGYTRAKCAEEQAVEVRAERMNYLFAQPAQTVSGVSAKLHAILALGEEIHEDEFPWRQIRDAMMDLLSLDGTFSGT